MLRRKHALITAALSVAVAAVVGGAAGYISAGDEPTVNADASSGELKHGDIDKANALGRRARLRALSATPLRIDEGGHTSVAFADVPTLFEQADLVFVGRPVARGGSEEVTPAGFAEPEASALTAHRVRFETTEVIRGPEAAAVDLMLFDVTDEYDRFEFGRNYLIFATEALLGSTQTPALIPVGYQQGVFQMGAGGRASNPFNGELRLEDVRKKLKEKEEK